MPLDPLPCSATTPLAMPGAAMGLIALPLGQSLSSGGVIAVLVGAALFGAVMLLILLLISQSIRRLRRSADRLAQGDLAHRVTVTGPLQLAALADALNQMAAQLQDRLATVVQQRNELGAVLSSMVEGVLAIDQDERILSLNRAAAELLGVEAADAIGRSIQEAVRNTALQGFVARTLHQNTSMQSEFTLDSVADTDAPEASAARTLQAQSAILRDADGARIGAVLVLHDVTRLRRLEAVRRDFVANVSHEVKTPVSAIKAAVETLQTGEPHDPEASERMLAIIARQADRLAAIVDDLLSLARIEQETGRVRAQLEPGRLSEVLRAASETCQPRARERQTDVVVRCDEQLRALINAPLLEQAVANLVDNAIKYSPEGTRVEVIGEASGQEVVVSVRDQGRGIEPEHLPRIFERFYRTDRARSRAMGGTGLGLSIVKHVAEAHGGRVSVDSNPGRGSVFAIHLQSAAGAEA